MNSKSSLLASLRSNREVVERRDLMFALGVRDRIRCRRHRLSVTMALLVTVALSTTGCSDDEQITPPTPEDPRKTIAGVIQELIAAYTTRDIERYSALFDQTDFMFVFDPGDVVEEGTPRNWDWPDEHSSNRNMFASQFVERIQLDVLVGMAVAPSKEDVGERPFPEGTMKVVLSEVDLSIDTRDPAGGENIIYTVDGDQAILFLFPDPEDIVDGVPIWKIFEWRDQKIGDLATISNSWGRLKHLFH